MLTSVRRMRIRRWMLLVLVVSIALALVVESSNRRRGAECARARDAYGSMLMDFDVGKIELMEGVVASERIMNAELSLWYTKEEEIAAISAHLGRAHDLIEREGKDRLALHLDKEEYIAEAELTLVEYKERLRRLRQNK